MELIITYLIYILGLVATIFMFLFFWTKVSVFREKRGFIRDLIDKGYEVDNIDLNNFLK